MSMADATTRTLAVHLSDIHKSFGPVLANQGASLEVAAGEIHALVGENGAGKSTLMRVLSGMYAPDSGRMEVNGRDVTGWSTNEAIDAGVGMVHQHFMLVPTLTVAENIVLGRELTKGLQLDRAGAEREVAELSRKTGLVVRPERLVADLSVGEAQRVEILKTLYRGAKILILDEPTAVLSPPEIDELWNVLRQMRARGETIVLITHKLDEVMEISDAITVMRHGKTVERLKTSRTTPPEIARAMVGRDVQLAMNYVAETSPRAAPPNGHLPPTGTLLDVRNLVVEDVRRLTAVNDVSFTIGAGEILGVAGVEGNGQTELLEALAGLRDVRGGSIRLGGMDVTGLNVKERGDAGLSHIPEDRHARGLILDYTVAENLILGQQHHFTRGVRLDGEKIAENAKRQIEAFDIRPADQLLPARALSGGNQQKIVIAKWLMAGPPVLLMNDPTRGVDVGTKFEIFTIMREFVEAGGAILFHSTELNELVNMCDSVLALYKGSVVDQVSADRLSEESLMRGMLGEANDDPSRKH